ncbi:DNA-3-methyladenine glycosylase I [Marispirochaeta aestuarii]|uniref:DNA-3-methyladenine glycosylase I n=1 Tax=Marispirochaeta aestuarii TaxID=1963862 RepID=UPI002ABD5805|nr:DNA-3-methyladenine glycosylase I [Marispirochaeta aestuarii]
MKKRCAWVNPENSLMREYHDTEWGVPVHDDIRLFEMLILEGAQAGLSWDTILKKRRDYREAFEKFDPVKVAAFSEEKIRELLQDNGIVRNRLKIQSAVKNARVFLEIRDQCGSFDTFIWKFVDGNPIDRHFAVLQEIPTKDELSERISRDLKKRGMSFVGPTIIYAYIQAIGLINSHTPDCFRYRELKA